ncbi:MAG: DUF1992 domain-containing protein [Thermodesulfobacteriota bacterium]
MFAYLTIVEQRIVEAQKRGDFKNLPGAGKPLTFEDDNIPEELRLAYKILKHAGCLPPEVELRKEIRRTEDLLASMEDAEEKYRTIKKLNLLIRKCNMMRGGPVNFDIPEAYEQKLVERFGAQKSGTAR